MFVPSLSLTYSWLLCIAEYRKGCQQHLTVLELLAQCLVIIRRLDSWCILLQGKHDML